MFPAPDFYTPKHSLVLPFYFKEHLNAWERLGRYTDIIGRVPPAFMLYR